MTELKLVMSTKDGKSYQRELKSPEADIFISRKIGDKVRGDDLGLPGYEFEIRGGSDKCGFPMRKDVEGTARRKLFSTKSLGIHTKRRKGKKGKKATAPLKSGMKRRKTVAGNTVHEDIAQVNLCVIKQGSVPLAPKTGAEKEAAGKAEKKPETEKEKPAEKKSEVKEEKNEAKPVEPKKKEVKAEAKPEEKKGAKPEERSTEAKEEKKE